MVLAQYVFMDSITLTDNVSNVLTHTVELFVEKMKLPQMKVVKEVQEANHHPKAPLF